MNQEITTTKISFFESCNIDRRNRFAYEAAYHVASTPYTSFNPLFIYGNRYDGKTSLLRAMNNYILRTSPQLQVVYVTAEEFICEYLKVIRKDPQNLKYLEAFRRIYRGSDVLLMDDIDFLAGKSIFNEDYRFIVGEMSTPIEEVLYTFDSLYDKGSRIVITSSRPPRKLGDLDAMFGKRFEMGLVVGLRDEVVQTKDDIEYVIYDSKTVHEEEIA